MSTTKRVSLFDCYAHLLIDLLLEDIITTQDPSARVYNRKGTLAPSDVTILSVTCRTRLLCDDSLAGAGQTVEEGTLAHVGASYDGY